MLNKDYSAKLLDLEDVIITKVENFCEEVHVYLELPRMKHRCPACGTLTDRVHDYRMQRVKDIPLGRATLLHLRKRHYRCDCGKRFFEKNTFLPRHYCSTSRLVAEIITAFRETVSASKDWYAVSCFRCNGHAILQIRLFQAHQASGGAFHRRIQGQFWRSEIQQYRCRRRKSQGN